MNSYLLEIYIREKQNEFDMEIHHIHSTGIQRKKGNRLLVLMGRLLTQLGILLESFGKKLIARYGPIKAESCNI